MYFELAAKLAWEPRKTELLDFLRHYTICRYGLHNFHRMSKFINKLVQAVYSSYHDVDADYQRRLKINPASPLEMYRCMKGVNKLRKTLRMALAEKRRLRNNIFYQHDLADVLRQLLTNLFNFSHGKAMAAFYAGERIEFDRYTKTMIQLMLAIERVLAVREDYRIDTIVDGALKMPSAGGWVEKQLKDKCFTFAYSTKLLDYQGKDMYELVRYYYRPRVKAWISTLSSALKEGKKEINLDELIQVYKQIEHNFVEKLLPKEGKREINIVGLVEEEFASIHDYEVKVGIPKGEKLKIGKRVGWHEDFSEISDWNVTNSGGEMTTDGNIATLKSVDKWFLYGADLDLPLRDYPILVFKYRTVQDSPHGGAWIWITWEDENSKTHRHCLWQGRSKNWKEVKINVYEILKLVGNPERIKRIELNNQEPPHLVQWDWIKFVSASR